MSYSELRLSSNETVEALYKRMYPRLYRYAYSFLRQKHDSEDAVQETFARLIPKCPLNLNDGWLITVCRNCCMDRLRKRKKNASIETNSQPMTSTNNSPDEEALKSQINSILLSLNENHREALRLQSAGFSYAEIADAMKVSVGTVGTYIHRGMNEIRQKLKNLR